MKKFQVLILALITASFFVIACDDNKKEEIDESGTDIDEVTDTATDTRIRRPIRPIRPPATKILSFPTTTRSARLPQRSNTTAKN